MSTPLALFLGLLLGVATLSLFDWPGVLAAGAALFALELLNDRKVYR